MPHTSSLSDDIHLLGDILGQVIRQQAGIALFDLVERIRALTKARRAEDADPETDDYLVSLIDGLDLERIDTAARAFTSYFDLINVAEDEQRARSLRNRLRADHPAPIAESIGNAVARLKDMGVSSWDMQQLMDRLRIELVFTAHPTEAKRRSVLSKLRRISGHLRTLERQDLLPRERTDQIDSIRAEVTSLWLTERTRTTSPKVTDEVRTTLYHVEETIWEALPEVYGELEAALAAHYPTVRAPRRFLTFGSWVGGDRDGNPNVTTEITAKTLRLHRGLAVRLHLEEAVRLERSLSLSSRLVDLDAEAKAFFERLPEHVSEEALRTYERYPNEPFRLLAADLAARLDVAVHDQVVPQRLLGFEVAELPSLRTQADLTGPLDDLDRLLRMSGAGALANAHLANLRRKADAFGLHVAGLDIRHYSQDIMSVLSELLCQLEIHTAFSSLAGSEQQKLLSRLLGEPIPALPTSGLSESTTETLRLFDVIRRAMQIYGSETIGAFIISFTQAAEHVLSVLLLAYWTGLALHDDVEGPTLPIAPLFETRQDLRNAPNIISALLKEPAYLKHLNALGREQMVMIGYSDSNKDAGYLTGRWELYQAQDALSRWAKTADVRLNFFHGRGGTIARGGGSIRQAVGALPTGSVDGRLRVTEQGEVIYNQYGHPTIARRHLEQVVHAVLMGSIPGSVGNVRPKAAWVDAMEKLSATAYRAYRKLVYETPALVTYWRQATTIREISRLRIGSRPARRSTDANLDGLRAIPWVFSWMQSRHVLPGWYGLGMALDQWPDPELLVEMHAGWPFFQAVIENAEISIGKADMGIARLYAGLVDDAAVREEIFGTIEAEYQRTKNHILAITGQNVLLENNPVLRQAIISRNPYVDPLNFIQVSLLRRLRALPDQESPEAEELMKTIFLSINGIAAGLKNTG